MLLSNSNRNNHASMTSSTESLVGSDGMKNKSDFSDLDQGNTADLKMVFEKKKIDYLLYYWLLMIGFLLILVGSAVFIFFTQGSGNKAPVCYSFFQLEHDNTTFNYQKHYSF